MLGSRYVNDGKSLLELNELQKSMKGKVEQKIQQGSYSFESVTCCVCGGKNFEILAEKDRYGLYCPVVICRGCGLIQINPRMSWQAYREFYQREYRKLYDGTEQPLESYFLDARKKGEGIYRFLGEAGCFQHLPQKPFVVEIGCGTGGILSYFKEKGCLILGADLGEEYVRFGRDRYGLDLVVGTIHDLSLPRTPDVIIYSHVLEHVLEPVNELKVISGLLSPTSYLYLEMPGVKNLSDHCELDFLRALQNAHTYYFTLRSLANLLKQHGFEMLYGTEYIKGVFKKRLGGDGSRIVNDYEEVMRYLKRAERIRGVIPSFVWSGKAWVIYALICFLRVCGLHSWAKGVFRKLRRVPC